MEEPIEHGTYIQFVPMPPKPKTKTWEIQERNTHCPLGGIMWYAPWRKYAAFFSASTVYEEACLREVADFCERKTREHRTTRKEITCG
jgi:hypothetical protein